MSELTLRFPVHDLDKRLLLPAGTALTQSVLDDLAAAGRRQSVAFAPLLGHGTVAGDLRGFLSRPPYRTIFADQADTARLIALLEKARLPLALLAVLDFFKANDFHTYRHLLMVLVLSTLLARDLFSDTPDRLGEIMAGPTHDFGKVCVPLKILQKRTPLSRSEVRLLEHHPVAGYVLLSYYLGGSRHVAARVARDHHERRDGTGYPRRIVQTDPLVEIVTASDIYDALISPRPYRPVSYDNRTALEELSLMAEKGQIGWEVVKALVAHNRRRRTHFSEVEIPAERRGTPPPDNAYGIVVEDDIPV